VVRKPPDPQAHPAPVTRLRAALARTRRVWLPILGLGLLVYGFSIVRQEWFSEDTLAEAWLLFALWAWVLAVVTATAYESVRPVLETGTRDRAWARIIYGLMLLPLVGLIVVFLYGATRPADQGLSLEISFDGFFLFLMLLLVSPSLLSTILAGGLFLRDSDRAWAPYAYWACAALVLLGPMFNTILSNGFVYEQGGGLIALGLMVLLAPVYVRFWKWRPRRKGVEKLYSA